MYDVAGSLIYSCSSQELLSLYGAPPQGAASNSVDEEFLALAEAIPGQPGEDYPVYSQPPDTSFTCADKIEVHEHSKFDFEGNCIIVIKCSQSQK